MSPRRLVQIADTPTFPTIRDYFGMMAEEQRDDILRLKQEAAGKNSARLATPPPSKAGPDPWLLYPIRRTRGSAAKSSARTGARSAAKHAPKKAAKKAAEKASKKSRR